ncbi:hypothetical protein GRJ2_000693000 [Grus japonensis]|uniref:Uncharacterized protein n=1 Tax=Grus japonensis TaxID=30415 RepID=A0ABC9WC32_GRUJA
MVGVSVCHHTRVGIRGERQPCWSCVVFPKCELQAEEELPSFGGEEGGIVSSSSEGKIKPHTLFRSSH